MSASDPSSPRVPDPESVVLEDGAARWLMADGAALAPLSARLAKAPFDAAEVARDATRLVERVREQATRPTVLTALLREYDLSSEEGVLLMSLAEALLRIPDPHTADRLIADKLTAGDWAAHRSVDRTPAVNAATFGLEIAARRVRRSMPPCGAP